MTTYEIIGPSVTRDDFTLSDVQLASTVERAVNASAYYVLRVGLRKGDNTDWLGSSQASSTLSAGTPASLLPPSRRGTRLRAGQVAVIEVKKVGTPPSLVGSSATFHFALDGDVRGKSKSLLASLATADPGLRDLIVQLNEKGIGSREYAIPLTDQTTDASEAGEFATYHDYDASAQAVSSSGFSAGNVGITVVIPSGKTTVSVIVQANCTLEDNSGSGAHGHMAINNGSGNQVEAQAHSNGIGEWRGIGVNFAEDITVDTTYNMFLKKSTNNINVKFQQISAIACAV